MAATTVPLRGRPAVLTTGMARSAVPVCQATLAVDTSALVSICGPAVGTLEAAGCTDPQRWGDLSPLPQTALALPKEKKTSLESGREAQDDFLGQDIPRVPKSCCWL